MDLPPDAGKKPLKSFVMALCSLTERTQNLWAQGRTNRSPAWHPRTDQIAYEYSDMRGNIERVQLR